MDLEQQLRSTYAERLGELDLPGGDAGAARRTGARMRARRRLAVGAAAVVVLAVAAGGTLLGTGRVSVGPSGGPGHWRELPAPPLSPRAYAQAVWTGHEVLVLGGEEDPCSPGADCAVASEGRSDGAAYDPQAGTWRRITPAPVPVDSGDRLLAAEGKVVLRHFTRSHHPASWWVYDPTADSWTRAADPPSGTRDLPSSYGSSVYAVDGSRVVVYDVRTGAWSRLPRDPGAAVLTGRRVTATAAGPVVSGVPALNGVGGDVVWADVFDGRHWRRLPPTGQLGNDWAWAGDRMVDFDSYEHQGTAPQAVFSLGGILDPATGRWSPLPDSARRTPDDPWSPVAIGPGPWAAGWGLVYDVRGGRAWPLQRPGGAAPDATAAAWAGDRLLVFGGVDWGHGPDPRLSNGAWLWTP
jgi:hypothetical protein